MQQGEDPEGAAITLDDYFIQYDRVAQRKEDERLNRQRKRTTLQNYLTLGAKEECNGFQRMQKCRQGLEAIDRRGWQRSFHQRMFHDNFIRACARIFWKREKHGVFARDHQRILEVNGWDHLSQEVLVSTPRRFGKTISVSMFAAAMLYSCPNLEMSIYSTCKVVGAERGLRSPHAFTDAFLAPAAHLAEAAAEHPKVPGADLPRAGLREDEGDPDQHGGDRGPGQRVRAGRADGQLLPEQGSTRIRPVLRETPVLRPNRVQPAELGQARALGKVLRDQVLGRLLQRVQPRALQAQFLVVTLDNLTHQPPKGHPGDCETALVLALANPAWSLHRPSVVGWHGLGMGRIGWRRGGHHSWDTTLSAWVSQGFALYFFTVSALGHPMFFWACRILSTIVIMGMGTSLTSMHSRSSTPSSRE